MKADPKTNDIPVVFVTAKTEVEDETKGLKLGAVDYITKPISPPILLARVRTHLQLKEARDFHVDWTPRGWMRKDLDLLGFEQQLYLRQPGYGTSYITGKYLIERLMAERGRQLGDDFTLSGFYEEVDALGVIPVSLIRWQLTGKDDEIRSLTKGAR